MLPSVNYHLWKPCNMRCKFCFATFQDIPHTQLPKGHLPEAAALRLVNELAAHPDIQKITFAGGEPTLCPWLPELIGAAKQKGVSTMLVTNGTQLSQAYLAALAPVLDWVALSIDSLSGFTNQESGRRQGKARGMNEQDYRAIIERVKAADLRLKINTVVSSWNFDQDMTSLIHWAKPERWKILQALAVEGQNNDARDGFTVSAEEFASFVRINSPASEHTHIVAETNELITGSYVMVDPAGRFFDDTAGHHQYSQPILEVGIEKAYTQVQVNADTFQKRDGYYDY